MKIPDYHKGITTLSIVVTVFGAVTVIGGAYWFYINSIWKPKVKLISVDVNAKRTIVEVDGKRKVINGNDTVGIAGDWGVRLSTEIGGVELVKKDFVYEYITP